MMQSDKSTVLFANTAVQYVCVPFSPSVRFSAEEVGYGWQHCQCGTGDAKKNYPYIQWQVAPGQNKLFLAVDTTLSEAGADEGYFAKASSLASDFHVALRDLVGANGQPLSGLGPIEFIIRPAQAEGGEPKDVHLIIDFGNSRTGALLLEFRGDVAREPMMIPLQLINRFHLDAWDEKGELDRSNAAWWFSSKTYWCATPFLDPPQVEKIVYDTSDDAKKKKKAKPTARTFFVTPEMFQDVSAVRLGREADDMSNIMDTDGEVRVGVSSPKRYLWAKDSSWLSGANWYMADPYGKFDNERHATTLKGPFLKYFPESDEPDVPEPKYDTSPVKPKYAPRLLMCGALYEMLAQAYSYINSSTYRRIAGEPGRMRRLRTVTLTYPSGMITPERERLYKQSRKAIKVFSHTLGKAQHLEPEFNLSIDEASAVHLTYIWSEVQKLGLKPSLWFKLMGRNRQPSPDKVPTEEVEVVERDQESATQQYAKKGPNRPPRHRSKRREKTAPTGEIPEVRVACIDIGGGTSDLMIAKYTCETLPGSDRVQGETLHRDGISLAGDHLVKRLLESIIVPHFADVIGLEDHDVQRLFGPEIAGSNSEFRAQRINWVNRLWVPLAQAYLQCAVNELDDEEISHTNVETVAPEVLESLQNTIDRFWQVGEYNVNQSLDLYFDRERFEDIVHEVFDDVVFDFCQSIVDHRADVVLLAGQPTKLRYIQDLVQTYLPLPQSRIIPMFNRYVGTWYPYQNPDHMNPGVIVEPKSAVVVGAAIEFSARFGMLSKFKFKMSDEAAKCSYYWGVMTESRIDAERILFDAVDDGQRARGGDQKILNVSGQRLVIGRKRREYENAQASPAYVLKIDPKERIGEIDVNVTLQRATYPDGEEKLEVTRVDGTVAGQPAILDENVFFEWRTLVAERYYLDTGGLDKIELAHY
jgi:hypothetical protein